MTARRKIPAALVTRLLAIYTELDALNEQLAAATAKELVACNSPQEAERILERFIAQLIAKLDERAAELGLPADYHHPRTLH